MSDWLTLPLNLAVFYGIGVVATLALLLQLLMMFLGFGDGIDGADAGEGLGLVSLRSITGFMGGLGWGAALALEHGASPAVATVVGSVAGGSLMLSVAGGIRLLYSLRESGNLDFSNAIGKVATVYIPIPARERGPGKILLEIQGRLSEITAYTQHEQTIPSQRKVEVLAMVDECTVLVGPLNPSTATVITKGVSSHA